MRIDVDTEWIHPVHLRNCPHRDPTVQNSERRQYQQFLGVSVHRFVSLLCCLKQGDLEPLERKRRS